MRIRQAVAAVVVVVAPILLFLLEEGWIIAITGKFGFWLGIPLVTTVLFIPTVMIGWAIEQLPLPDGFKSWVEKWRQSKETQAKAKLEKAKQSALWFSLLAASVVVSPSLSAAMLKLLGKKGIEFVWYNVLLSLICAIVWCGVYSGAWRIIHNIF